MHLFYQFKICLKDGILLEVINTTIVFLEVTSLLCSGLRKCLPDLLVSNQTIAQVLFFETAIPLQYATEVLCMFHFIMPDI